MTKNSVNKKETACHRRKVTDCFFADKETLI
nr:MAG TPA: hypothetical protein [Caudoviricetes sp.]